MKISSSLCKLENNQKSPHTFILAEYPVSAQQISHTQIIPN